MKLDLINSLNQWRQVRRLHRSRIWMVELPVMAIGLGLIGVTATAADPLLDRINPSPYLLLPLLFGAAYGTGAGIGGAVMALATRCGVVLSTSPGILAASGEGSPLAEAVRALAATGAVDPVLVIALFVVGVLCGELREELERELAKLQIVNDSLSTQIDGLSQEFLLLKETKSGLERRLAEVADSRTTIFDEAIDLYTLSADGVDLGILRLLGKYASVEEAALYRLEQGRLRLTAQFGTDEYRPPEIYPERQQLIVKAALETGKTVTVRDLAGAAGGAPAQRQGLIAAPLLARADGFAGTGQGQSPATIGVVVVDAIPFVRLSESTVRMISLITDWGAQVIREQESQQQAEDRGMIDPILQVYQVDYVKERLADEFRRARKFNLDLHLLAVAPVTGNLNPVYREGMGLLTVAAAREGSQPGDVLGISDQEAPHAVMIMPMTDQAAAERRLQLIRSLWAGQVRSELQGEELPPLEALLVSAGDQTDERAMWQRIDHWVAEHA